MEAVGIVTKTAKGFFGDSGVSIDNWTFKFFYKVMYYFTFQINVNESNSFRGANHNWIFIKGFGSEIT
jgi:hypothetical protein